MNDRELMKKVYDRPCADRLSAGELLENTGEPARIRSRAPALAVTAAAAVIAVGAVLFMKYKSPEVQRSDSAVQAESVTLPAAEADPPAESEAAAASAPESTSPGSSAAVGGSLSEEERRMIESDKSLAGADISGTVVLQVISPEDISSSADISELSKASKRRSCLVPGVPGSLSIVDFSADGEYISSVGTVDASVLEQLGTVKEHIDRFYPGHGEIKLFSITDTDDFTALCCFTDSGEDKAVMLTTRFINPGIGFIEEYPINGQVYPLEHIKVWAGRSRTFTHAATNSVVLCDFSTDEERVEMLTDKQLSAIKEWYAAHETDAVNVPADGSQGDRRFIPSRSAAYAGFDTADGCYVVISRAYGSPDGSEGLCVVVRNAGGICSFRWYDEKMFPDTSAVTEILDGLFGISEN